MAEDGTFEGGIVGPSVYDETLIEEQERIDSGKYATTLTRNQTSDETSENSYTPSRPGHYFDIFEKFRLTIEVNPGIVERASGNVGLGHAFLRSMERSHLLVYVVNICRRVMDGAWCSSRRTGEIPT